MSLEVTPASPQFVRMRHVMASVLAYQLGAPERNQTVNVVRFPWDHTDFPYVAVHHDRRFIDGSEEASVCTAVARWRLGLFVGTPGNTAADYLLDEWIEILAHPDALGRCVDDQLWPNHSPRPIVEEIDGGQQYDVFGMLLIGAAARIRTEFHHPDQE